MSEISPARQSAASAARPADQPPAPTPPGGRPPVPQRRSSWSALLRFGLLGGVLLAVDGLSGPGPRQPLPATAANAAVAPALGISNPRDQEILFREALRDRLHWHDPVVRQRLVRNLRFLGLGDERQSPARLVQQAIALGLHEHDPIIRRRLLMLEERRILQRHGLRPLHLPPETPAPSWTPERLDLHHVFLAPDPDGSLPRQRAQALLEELSARQPETQPPLVGDPFPGGGHRPGQDLRLLQRDFGPRLAEQVFSLPTGFWQGPLVSPYGLHLFLVTRRQPAEGAVSPPSPGPALSHQAHQVLADHLARLRPLYQSRP